MHSVLMSICIDIVGSKFAVTSLKIVWFKKFLDELAVLYLGFTMVYISRQFYPSQKLAVCSISKVWTYYSGIGTGGLLGLGPPYSTYALIKCADTQ